MQFFFFFIELSEEIADCCFFIGNCINVGGLTKVDTQSFVGCVQFLESFIATTKLVWVSLQGERFELSGELSQGWKITMKAKDQAGDQDEQGGQAHLHTEEQGEGEQCKAEEQGSKDKQDSTAARSLWVTW